MTVELRPEDQEVLERLRKGWAASSDIEVIRRALRQAEHDGEALDQAVRQLRAIDRLCAKHGNLEDDKPLEERVRELLEQPTVCLCLGCERSAAIIRVDEDGLCVTCGCDVVVVRPENADKIIGAMVGNRIAGRGEALEEQRLALGWGKP